MTQSYNLSQFANKLNSSGQLDATVGLVNAVPAANGGTGQSSYTVGDILYASGSTTLAKLSGVATGNVLISGGVGVAPSYGKVGLTTHVSGTLPLTNGGLGTTSFTSNALLVGNGTSTFQTISPGSSGQVLTSNGTTWSSAALSAIGVGQTWTDVKTSPGRTSGTPYTNSTGKPIMVIIGVTAVSASPNITVVVGGVTIINYTFPYGNGNPVTFIVPDGVTYSGTWPSGTTLAYWNELR